MQVDRPDDGEGSVQAQFLEAFKELLELQNVRMTSQIGEIINQYFPHLIFPLILPTQIPNTYIINLGPYANQTVQPVIFQNMQSASVQMSRMAMQRQIPRPIDVKQEDQQVEEDQVSESNQIDGDQGMRFVKFNPENQRRTETRRKKDE